MVRERKEGGREEGTEDREREGKRGRKGEEQGRKEGERKEEERGKKG